MEQSIVERRGKYYRHPDCICSRIPIRIVKNTVSESPRSFHGENVADDTESNGMKDMLKNDESTVMMSDSFAVTDKTDLLKSEIPSIPKSISPTGFTTKSNLNSTSGLLNNETVSTQELIESKIEYESLNSSLLQTESKGTSKLDDSATNRTNKSSFFMGESPNITTSEKSLLSSISLATCPPIYVQSSSSDLRPDQTRCEIGKVVLLRKCCSMPNPLLQSITQFHFKEDDMNQGCPTEKSPMLDCESFSELLFRKSMMDNQHSFNI